VSLLAARRASALPSERLSSDVPAVAFAGAVQPPAAERSSVLCAAAVAVAEASTGARERPPEAVEAAAVLVQLRAAVVAPAGSAVEAAAEVALGASVVAEVLPRAAVAPRASAAEVLRPAAAGPDAPVERRQVEHPSPGASFRRPVWSFPVPAPAPSARFAPVLARLRIAWP
jgi:hypothetical protein